MLLRKKLNLAVSMVVVMVLILTLAAQCKTPAPTEAPKEEEKVEATEEKAEEKAEEQPAEEQAAEEKTLVFVLPEDPPSFNAFLTDTGYEELVAEFVFEGLSDIDENGNYYPRLAKELPTKENGGVSEDGLTITWKLRDDVYWSDGEKFTSEDVKYTWQALTESGTWYYGYDLIEDIETPDEFTAVVHYSEFYPHYLVQFGGEGTGLFPAHYCGEPATLTDWKCNREPISTGAFILEEWVAGDHLTFVKNPNYWNKGYPKVDKIRLPIVPDESVRKEMVINGDAHIDMWITESLIDEVNNSGTARVEEDKTGRWLLALRPNLSEKGLADPTKPHPIISDKRVRQAMMMAIDKDIIIKQVFLGHSMKVDTEFFREPYKCDVSNKYAYDPEGAKALLEEAGWKDEDGDGIRECHGCGTTEDGTRMSVENIIYSEYGEELELAQQLIADQMKQVGIEFTLRMEESGILWGDWESNGVEVRGNFDIDLWDDGYFGVEPIDYMYEYYACGAIPTEEDPGAGFNIGRYCNESVDEAFDELYSLLPTEERKELYCEVADIFSDELPILPLFVVTEANAVSNQVQNVTVTINDNIGGGAYMWEFVE